MRSKLIEQIMANRKILLNPLAPLNPPLKGGLLRPLAKIKAESLRRL
jgi:hypothetical protein